MAFDVFGEEPFGQMDQRNGTTVERREVDVSESDNPFGAPLIEAEATSNILGDLSTESSALPSADDPFGLTSPYKPEEQLDIFSLTDTPTTSNHNASQQQVMFDFMMDPSANQTQNLFEDHTPQQEAFDLFSSDTISMQSNTVTGLIEGGSNTFLDPMCDDIFATEHIAANNGLAVDGTQTDPFDSFLGLDTETQSSIKQDSVVFDDIFSSAPGTSQTSTDLVDGFLDPITVDSTETKEGGTASSWMDDLLS